MRRSKEAAHLRSAAAFSIMTRTKGKDLVLEYLGSLIMIKGEERCLGYLIYREDKGWTYDSEYGRVNVSKEHAEIHNKELTKALLQGLDETCEVGQGGTFYYHEPTPPPAQVELKSADDLSAETHLVTGTAHKPVIKTFTGEVVSDDLMIHGYGSRKWITFSRNNRKFRGRKPKPGVELFHFQRVE